MDKEDMSSDETAGSILFFTKDIIEGHYGEGKFFWKNVYGSPMNMSDSKYKREMNLNPEVASFWKGRILFEVLCIPTEKPLSKSIKMDKKTVAIA
jgi:hypothetical protein